MSRLESMIHYHFDEKYKASASYVVGKYSFVFFCSGGALWLYVDPSLQYAGSSLIRKIGFLSGALGANFSSLFWASDSVAEYLHEHVKNHVLKTLKADKRSTSSTIAASCAVLIGGILPSIVPAAAAYQTSLGSVVLKATESICVFSGNLPLNMYGSLNLLNDHSRLLKRSPNTVRDKLKEDLEAVLAKRIEDRFFDDLRDLTGVELLSKIMSYKNNHDPVITDLQHNRTFKILSMLRVLFGVCGVIFGETELTGYTLATQKLVQPYLVNNVGIWIATAFIMAIPVYLSALFGYDTFTKMWDLVGSVFGGDFKKPLPFLLFPKLSACMLMLALGCASLSYATSVQLVKDNFNEPYSTPLQWFAQLSTTMFNGYGAVNFVQNFMLMIALRFGSNQEKIAAFIANSVSSFIADLEKLEPSEFSQLIQGLSVQEAEGILDSSAIIVDQPESSERAEAVGHSAVSNERYRIWASTSAKPSTVLEQNFLSSNTVTI